VKGKNRARLLNRVTNLRHNAYEVIYRKSWCDGKNLTI